MIKEIHQKIRDNQYEFSEHAVNQSILRRISLAEIKQAILQGKIIENYPDDKYGASCLIFGWTEKQRPLHIHCIYPTCPLIKIIIIYQPDPNFWINYQQRR